MTEFPQAQEIYATMTVEIEVEFAAKFYKIKDFDKGITGKVMEGSN